MREVKKLVGLSFMSYGTLFCLQGSLLEGRSTQFMWIINVKIPSAPGGFSSGQTVKPNSILKAGVLW